MRKAIASVRRDAAKRLAHLVLALVAATGVAQAADMPMPSAPAAPPPPSPWYIEGSAGALWRMNDSYSTNFTNLTTGTTGPGTNTTRYDPGYDFNFGVGYKMPWGLRVEIEGGFAQYSDASVSPLSTNGALPFLTGQRLGLQSDGTHTEYSGTLNVFYDFPALGRFVPYIGGGAGGHNANVETGVFVGPGGVPHFTQFGGNSTGNTMAFGEVGMAVTLDDKWAVVPSYRFQKVFTASDASPNTANIFKLGLRYSL
jgi:opacity protein-like surface antigen